MEDALIVSPREFRMRQKTYLNKIDEGIKVIINGRRRSYKVEATKDPYRMTKEEYFAMLDRSEQQYKEGKYTSCKTAEETRAFLDSL